jgi:phosphoribosylformimino-5-aminoimidazole carboxamide ribotide isomerase
MDLKSRVVVRGVGGRRAEYRPIVSRLTSSCNPLDVAEAFRTRLGLDELYLANLDAISGQAPAVELFRQLCRGGFHLWVDAGIRTSEHAEPLIMAGVENVVAGLETLTGPVELERLAEQLGQRLIFSLDLKGGRPLATGNDWPPEPAAIAAEAVGRGARRLLILDLAQVGEGRGTGTEELCRRLVSNFPDVAISAGGGVRGLDDLLRLRDVGVQAVLVASALHDGRIGPEEISALAQAGRHS